MVAKKWVQPCLCLLNSNIVNKSSISSTILQAFACNECCLLLSLKMDEKLIEVVRKCEELYDMSNKKYSNSVWKEKVRGQIGDELKKSGKFLVFLLHIMKSLSSCYYKRSNN